MGDSLTSALNRGKGLKYVLSLLYEYTIYKRPIPIQELRPEEVGGLIIHHGLIIRTIRIEQHMEFRTQTKSMRTSTRM